MSSDLLTFRRRYDTIQETEREGSMSAEMKPNMNLANFLKKRMKQEGVTQKDFTDRFGIPKATVSRWLNGNIGDPPELPTFVAFSEALQTPLWRLLEQAGFEVERPTDPAESDRRLARQIEATPELRPIVQWLFDLDLNDRAAVMTFVEILQRRRAESDETQS